MFNLTEIQCLGCDSNSIITLQIVCELQNVAYTIVVLSLFYVLSNGGRRETYILGISHLVD